MPAKHARHIALSGPLAEWAERQVASGEYSSLSELIRTALRTQRAQDDARFAIAEKRASASTMGRTGSGE